MAEKLKEVTVTKHSMNMEDVKSEEVGRRATLRPSPEPDRLVQ